MTVCAAAEPAALKKIIVATSADVPCFIRSPPATGISEMKLVGKSGQAGATPGRVAPKFAGLGVILSENRTRLFEGHADATLMRAESLFGGLPDACVLEKTLAVCV